MPKTFIYDFKIGAFFCVFSTSNMWDYGLMFTLKGTLKLENISIKLKRKFAKKPLAGSILFWTFYSISSLMHLELIHKGKPVIVFAIFRAAFSDNHTYIFRSG